MRAAIVSKAVINEQFCSKVTSESRTHLVYKTAGGTKLRRRFVYDVDKHRMHVT